MNGKPHIAPWAYCAERTANAGSWPRACTRIASAFQKNSQAGRVTETITQNPWRAVRRTPRKFRPPSSWANIAEVANSRPIAVM